MKNSLVFFLLLMSFSLFAQKNKKEKKTNTVETNARKTYLELGINVSGAIAAGGFRLKDELYNSDPFFLNMKFIHKDVAFRTGFGGGVSSKKEVNIIDGRIKSINNFNLKAGFDIQTPIDDRWRLYYGFDGLLGYSKGQNDFSIGGDVTNIRYTSNSLGLGPLLGLQFRLNKRISLQTEATLYFINTQTTKTVQYISQPNLPILPSKTNEWSTPIGIPRSLFVIIKL